MIGGLVARHDISVQRAPLVDDGRGNLTRNWAAAQTHSIPGWAIDAGATAEDTANRDGSSVEYTIRGPYAADVDPDDRIVLLGGTYLVDGGVRRQPGPTPRTSHTILQLVRWEG